MKTTRKLSIQDLFQQAEPYLKMRNDSIHTRVAHGYALLLLEKEGGDRNIVEPAIILHDVGWSALKPGDITHAARHAFLSKKIDNWFFTRTAKALAEKELQARDKESDMGFL